MAPPSFRPATTDDVGAVVALVQVAYRAPAASGWTSEAELIGGQRVDAGMLADTLARDDTVVVLAHDGDRLLACCELTRPTPAGAAHLGMFAVDPAAQGGGLGGTVLDEAERIARDEWGARTLELEVIAQRVELIGWYERRGYRRTGRVEPFPYGDERFGIPTRPDLVFEVLAKDLDPTPPR